MAATRLPATMGISRSVGLRLKRRAADHAEQVVLTRAMLLHRDSQARFAAGVIIGAIRQGQHAAVGFGDLAA